MRGLQVSDTGTYWLFYAVGTRPARLNGDCCHGNTCIRAWLLYTPISQ